MLNQSRSGERYARIVSYSALAIVLVLLGAIAFIGHDQGPSIPRPMPVEEPRDKHEDHSGLPVSSDPAVIAFREKDYKTSLQIWLARATKGDAEAEYATGLFYEDGDGIPVNYFEAVQWYKKSAALGYAAAERQLGLMYENGTGLPQNYVAARSWYMRAARQGDSVGQLYLAGIYANGEGVSPDGLSAYVWSDIAASVGSGLVGATQLRDKLAPTLSADDLSRAQEFALVCQQSHYRRCGPFTSVATSGEDADSVKMQEYGGAYVVPVILNGVVSIGFVVDSGSADVQIPDDVARTLFRAGTLTKDDMTGSQEFQQADGTTSKDVTFQIRSLKVGNIVLENVLASIGGANSAPLLGQTFLSRFATWSIDNGQHVLHLKPVDATFPSTGSGAIAGRVEPMPASDAATSVPAKPVNGEPVRQPKENVSPTFDCSKATVLTETTICGDANLSALDSKYAAKWTEVTRLLKSKHGQVQYLEVRDHVRAFLERRNRCNASAPCIAQAYDDIALYLTSVIEQ